MRAILTHPDERLRQKSEPVTLFDDALADFFQELEQIMRAGPGGVGLAAPQVGVLRRLTIIDCSQSRRPCRNHGLLYMANPEVLASEGEALGREGCLSVPDWVAMVPRARTVRVAYQDVHGDHHELEASGFEARAILHEIDHLDGVLFIDRVVSTQGLMRRLAD